MSIETENQWYVSLIRWIHDHGGSVHADLELNQEDDSSNHCGRRILAKRDIPIGEVLVKIPRRIILCGTSLPSKYEWNQDSEKSETIQLHASSWLRCVASLMQAYEHKVPSQYLNSLPVNYDTLLSDDSWTDDQIRNYLSGTTLGSMVLKDRTSKALQTRFTQSVLPYLKYNDIMTNNYYTKKGIYQSFILACQCISTRGFHLQDKTSSSLDKEEEEEYEGPYLLPFIDLFNHSSDPNKICTALHQIQDDFIMVAERGIAAGEEIVHSYGSNNTSASLLQTFGFVDEYFMKRAASGVSSSPSSLSSSQSSTNDRYENTVTSAFLSKVDLLATCHTVSVSNLSNKLIRLVENEVALKDYDIWDMPSHDNVLRRNEEELKRQFAEELVVDYQFPLSDEIITICCSQFLPDEAYDEICTMDRDGERSICMLSSDILEDFFLGSLVIASLMMCVKKKLKTYIPLSDCIHQLNVLLSQEQENRIHTVEHLHEMYSLTISIEEQSCLMKLMEQLTSFQETLNLYDDRSNKRSKN